MSKKKKTDSENQEELISGVIYEYSPEEAEELGAFYDPAASEIGLDEATEELHQLNESISKLNEEIQADEK